jgi:hypothetical protein
MSKANGVAVGCVAALALIAALSCGGQGTPTKTVMPHSSATVSLPQAGALNRATPEPSPTRPPFGPTPMPVSQSDALWDWIAANTTECEPILRPTYLPSTLSRVSLHIDQQRGCVLFGVRYSDSAGETMLFVHGGPYPNPPLPAPETLREQLTVRQTMGTFQLQDAANARGQAFLWWREPGTWGAPGSDWHSNYVEYLIAAWGFSKEELLRVANGLQLVTRTHAK